MSPRIKILRKVLNPPAIKGMKPFGTPVNRDPKEGIILLLEEYEALRLCDYDGMNQLEASQMMGVSRPTFTRIYASALQKLAKVLVEGKEFRIEGGKVYFDSDWYQCQACFSNFNNPEKEKEVLTCPLCGHDNVVRFDTEEDIHESERHCPNCGHAHRYRSGNSKRKEKCPKCGSPM